MRKGAPTVGRHLDRRALLGIETAKRCINLSDGAPIMARVIVLHYGTERRPLVGISDRRALLGKVLQ